MKYPGTLESVIIYYGNPTFVLKPTMDENYNLIGYAYVSSQWMDWQSQSLWRQEFPKSIAALRLSGSRFLHLQTERQADILL